MYYLYYKTSYPNGGFRPSDKRGGGGVIHIRIEGGPRLKNFVSALRASVWSKNKREAGPPLDAPLAARKVIKDTLGFWIPRS